MAGGPEQESLREEDDERTQLLGFDPRYSFDQELEDAQPSRRSRFEFLSHSFMFFLLVLIVTLYVKNNYVYRSKEFSYIIALTLPLIALILTLTGIIYFNFIIKLADSHRSQYIYLTTSLVFVSFMLIAFAVLVGIYYSDPIDSRTFLYIAAIPYYLALLVISIFYIYFAPGTMDRRTVNLPTYLKFMMGVYLVFLFIYPIIYLIAVSRFEDTGNNGELKENPDSYEGQKVYNHSANNDDSGAIWIPFIIVIFVHVILMISDLLCKFGFKRALELSILVLLSMIAFLELYKYKNQGHKVFGIDQDGLGLPQIIVFVLWLIVWFLLYLVFFLDDKNY